MTQNYFVVVLAHSLHGRLRRIQIPHSAVYAFAAVALLSALITFGFLSSYTRMVWKVANYNSLRRESEALRQRYENLQKVVNQTNEQLASLQLLAKEVSIAYGIKQKLEGPADIAAEGRLTPTFTESLAEYNYLKQTSFTRFGRGFARRWHTRVAPSIWPVDGRLMGSFGQRTDPFSGEGAYHTGVDISAATGTSVRVTADGIVTHAGWSRGYGRLVVVDHGSGVQTYYAHLSRIRVIDNQEVQMGEIVGAVGTSGRSTGSHLHYEVRVGEAPVNPYRYHLAKSGVMQAAARPDFVF
jgi:murein DD-endopeptidase MepM/ murein hydrolase activator NlpD